MKTLILDNKSVNARGEGRACVFFILSKSVVETGPWRPRQANAARLKHMCGSRGEGDQAAPAEGTKCEHGL